MVSVREHVHRLDLGDVVVLLHLPQIPCQGGRIAGDVNDSFRPDFKNTGENLLMHAGPGRVNDHYLRLKREKGQVLADIPEKELAVLDSVCLTIPPGVENSALHDLHADHSPCGVREEDGDRAGAAVKIEDGFVALEFSKLGHLSIEPFGSNGIGLEKGVGGDLKQGGADPVLKDSVTGKDRFPFADRNGSLFCGDVVDHGFHVGEEGGEPLRKREDDFIPHL